MRAYLRGSVSVCVARERVFMRVVHRLVMVSSCSLLCRCQPRFVWDEKRLHESSVHAAGVAVRLARSGGVSICARSAQHRALHLWSQRRLRRKALGLGAGRDHPAYPAAVDSIHPAAYPRPPLVSTNALLLTTHPIRAHSTTAVPGCPFRPRPSSSRHHLPSLQLHPIRTLV